MGSGGGFPRAPRGKRGATTRVTGADGQQFEHNPKEEQFKPDKDMTGPLASVGMSVSVGASTEYAREKYEIAAWCTLPCKPEEREIVETYAVCYDFCVQEIARRQDEVEKVVFPHGMGEAQMTELEWPLRIVAVNVSDMRVEPMGVSNAIKGRFVLVDEQARPYAFAICHRYSERTYKILDALHESMEADLVQILKAGPTDEGDLEIEPYSEPNGNDEGVTFG